MLFPARGKSFSSNLNSVKSQENISMVTNHSPPPITKQRHKPTSSESPSNDNHTLSMQSRELSKSHGSLNPRSYTISNPASSKSYRGLSVFSPDSLDESDIIYQPPSRPADKDEFETIRYKGGFKGWVKNLVDKFSSSNK